MRILVLQPPAREQHAALDQCVDDRLVGVAFPAAVVDDARRPARPVRPETRRIPGEEAGIVDGEGDARIDPPGVQFPRRFRPGVEVLAAVTRRGVHETRAGIVGDVIAGEHGNVEEVPVLAKTLEWMSKH